MTAIARRRAIRDKLVETIKATGTLPEPYASHSREQARIFRHTDANDRIASIVADPTEEMNRLLLYCYVETIDKRVEANLKWQRKAFREEQGMARNAPVDPTLLAIRFGPAWA